MDRLLLEYVLGPAMCTPVALGHLAALVSRAGVPLGIGIPIAYLWGKQNEITNLRIIVKGASVGMPEDRVRGELILV